LYAEEDGALACRIPMEWWSSSGTRARRA